MSSTLIARRVLDPEEVVHAVAAREAFADHERRARWPVVRAVAKHHTRETAGRRGVNLTEICSLLQAIARDVDSVSLLRANWRQSRGGVCEARGQAT